MSRFIRSLAAACLALLVAVSAQAGFIATATNDWGAEIQPGNYTHAVNFGLATSVNGVAFQGAGLGAFTDGNTTYNNGPWGGIDANNIAGDSGLADKFIYSGGSSANINLTNLVSGQLYLFKFFSVGWNNTNRTTRIDDVDVAGEELTFDPDLNGPGADNGTVVSYLYTAQPDGQLNIALSFGGNQSPHCYALTNETIPEPTTLSLLALGGLGLLRRRSKRS